MADVCIIYAREDASNLPPALEKALIPKLFRMVGQEN